jgi:hypothetical protein
MGDDKISRRDFLGTTIRAHFAQTIPEVSYFPGGALG